MKWLIIPFSLFFIVVSFGIAFVVCLVAMQIGVEEKNADAIGLFIMGAVWWHFTYTAYQELKKPL